jgi:hypothetical protein
MNGTTKRSRPRNALRIRIGLVTATALARPSYAPTRLARPGASLPTVPSIRPVAANVVLTLALSACGTISTSPPAPTPADFGGIASELTRHGVRVGNAVSGDAGCTDPELIPTAIAVDAEGLDQASPVRLYLYIFRNRASFEKLRANIDACARAYVTDPGTFESVEQSPYVIAGQGPWAAQFEAAIRHGLEVAAGTGD